MAAFQPLPSTRSWSGLASWPRVWSRSPPRWNCGIENPLGVEERITAAARVTERRGRRLSVAGWLEIEGELAVEGSGLYIVTEKVSDIL